MDNTTNLVADLRGWRELDGMSDDARRKIWLMRKAADEIDRLRAAYLELARDVVADYDGIEGYVSSGTAHSAKRAVEDETLS